MQKLTEDAIAKLKPKRNPPDHEKRPDEIVDGYLWDPTLPGFGVRAHPSGMKSYVVKYSLPDGGQRKMSLGTAQKGMLAESRKAAANILLQARQGQDFVGQKRAAQEAAKVKDKRDLPLAGHVDRFLSQKEKVVKPSTHRELVRHLKVALAPLHDRRPEDIKRADLMPIINGLVAEGKRIAADRTKTSFVQFFNDLVELELCNGNPASGIKRKAVVDGDGVRARWLTMDELTTVWRATGDDSDYARILRLLALTGCRREEIGGLRWDEINFDKRQFLLIAKTGRTKKRDRLVFLSEPAMAILQDTAPRPRHAHVFGQRAGHGYSGWSKAKISLDKRMGNSLAPWVLHDFRRTFETNASMMELADDKIIHAATGHWGKVKTGVQKHYNLNEYEPQRRKLMTDWASAVLAHAGK